MAWKARYDMKHFISSATSNQEREYPYAGRDVSEDNLQTRIDSVHSDPSNRTRTKSLMQALREAQVDT